MTRKNTQQYMQNLKIKISTYLKDNNLTPTAFCRKANISAGIISNIISSENPNPTIDTALKIADLMNCSLDELFDRDFLLTEPLEINTDLLKSVCDCVCNLEEMKEKKFNDFYKITQHVYKYCFDNDLKKADKTFTKWYVTKMYDSDS